MIDYNDDYNPPAPVVPVQIINPVTGESTTVNALIDSGASVSVVLLDAVDEIGLKPVAQASVQGFGKIVQTVPVFRSTWVVAGHVLIGVEYVAVERKDALLGRDVLQHFILTLNGKMGQFHLEA